MNSPSEPFNDDLNIIESIRRQDSNSTDILFLKYHRGIQYLLRRYVADGIASVLVEQIVQSTVNAICAGKVKSASELAPFMRVAVYDALREIGVQARRPMAPSALSHSAIGYLADRMPKIFSPEQLAALVRYYLHGEEITEICHSMKISRDQFTFLCKIARDAASLSLALNGKRTPSNISMPKDARDYGQLA